MTFHANFHSFQATWLQRRQADKKWPALAVASLASRSLTWEGRLDTTASKPNVQAEAMNVETTKLCKSILSILYSIEFVVSLCFARPSLLGNAKGLRKL